MKASTSGLLALGPTAAPKVAPENLDAYNSITIKDKAGYSQTLYFRQNTDKGIVLENYEMEVVTATNGRQAIDLVRQQPKLDAVLMDIMMPEMDGYQTLREIRKIPQFRSLPILALTAKAMKGDREKCLEAGASDYIAKPVNTEQLLSLLRVWLYR